MFKDTVKSSSVNQLMIHRLVPHCWTSVSENGLVLGVRLGSGQRHHHRRQGVTRTSVDLLS